MHLAINYSTQAADLFKQHRIQVERFKCPDWPDLIAEASQLCQVAVHFTLRAGDGKLKFSPWATIDQMLNDTGTPYVNLHLETTTRDLPAMEVDTCDPEDTEVIYSLALEDIREAVKRYGAEQVIIENVPYRGRAGKVLRPSAEPAFISKLVDETGCGLLLDISHARIAAHHMGMDEQDYMQRLPVKALRELHFTGLHNLPGRLQDHLEILETDWPALDWVLDNIRIGAWPKPWLLAFEYGGVGKKFSWRSKREVIAEQLPRLHEKARSI